MVAGFGRVDAVDLGPAQSLRTVSYVRTSTPVSLVSAALSASFPLGEALRAGVRFPLVIGNLAPPADERRSATNLGNLEVGLQWRRPLSKNIDLRAALLLTLPTASGRELPNQSALDAAGPYADTISADHQSISRAAEYSRGAEDDALFEPGRLGLTPRLGFDVHESGFHFEPFVKSELLVTTQDVPDTIIVEFVAGGRIAYTLASWLDVGARAWGVFTVAGTTTHSLDVGVVEPELRLSYKAFHSTAGALLPFAGDLTSPYFVGARASISVAL